MMTDRSFWKNIVDAWISVQTAEEKEATIEIAKALANKQLNSTKKKVRSLFEELFGEDD